MTLKKLLSLGLLAMALALTVPAHAEKLWDHVGKIDSINGAQQTLMINDLPLKVTASTRFYSAGGTKLTFSDLKRGQMVGCLIEHVPGIGSVVTELRVYPANSRPRTFGEVY